MPPKKNIANVVPPWCRWQWHTLVPKCRPSKCRLWAPFLSWMPGIKNDMFLKTRVLIVKAKTSYASHTLKKKVASLLKLPAWMRVHAFYDFSCALVNLRAHAQICSQARPFALHAPVHLRTFVPLYGFILCCDWNLRNHTQNSMNTPRKYVHMYV